MLCARCVGAYPCGCRYVVESRLCETFFDAYRVESRYVVEHECFVVGEGYDVLIVVCWIGSAKRFVAFFVDLFCACDSFGSEVRCVGYDGG